MSDTFCPIPWIFQAIRSNGDIRVCCQANTTKNRGVVRKPSGQAYNAGVDHLQSSRNAELMRVIRKNMINGVWSEECTRCRVEEEAGLVSRRIYEQDKQLFSFDQAKQDTHEDGTIDILKTPVKYYDLRFGNFCNLKCRMCGPTDSNSWYADWMALTNSTKFSETSGDVEILNVNGKLVATEYNWPEYEPFWEALESNSANIDYVYFAGGEPLLIERHYDFLNKCIASGDSTRMIIEYNTNMSTLPSKVTNLWSRFGEVRVGASVDGMGKIQEYQRHPITWEKTLTNLHKLDQLPTNVVSWIAFTVTAYNVEHMVDFMKWKLQSSGFIRINSTTRRPIITHHVAHHPKHLNIRVLPLEYKQLVTAKFNQFVQWCVDQQFPHHIVKSATSIANGVTKYMNGDSYHDLWPEFVSYTRKLDNIRDEDIHSVLPNLSKYL